MEDLCTACLCVGRKLTFIGETGSYHLYTQILKEIPVYQQSVCVRVCWECRERLRGFGQFKMLVKTSYTYLLQYLNQHPAPSAESLARAPRLQTRHLAGFSFPDGDVKAEPAGEPCDLDMGDEELEVELKSVKEETFATPARRRGSSKKGTGTDLEEVKSEDEVRVEALEGLRAPARRKRTTKKTGKEKSKKKLKSKAKKSEGDIEVNVDEAEDKLVDCLIDSKVYLNEELSDRADDAYESDDDLVLKSVKERKNKLVSKKKTESKAKVRKKHKQEETMHDEDVEPAPVDGESEPPSRVWAEPEMVGARPKCGECGKMFSSKKTYRYHLNVLHKGQNRYPCPRCGKVYQWKSNLARHLRSHKARDSGELYCATCDKPFASIATYRQHLRISRRHVTESDYSFTCHECGKKFVSKTRLRDHVDWDHLHNIKFRCQICNKPFKCHTSLYVHLQNTHRNKKKENLCHICGKSYQNAAKLKCHIVAMHTSETPHRCGQCGAAFSWYSSLYRHVREVHHKMKLQPKKSRKPKRPSPPPLV